MNDWRDIRFLPLLISLFAVLLVDPMVSRFPWVERSGPIFLFMVFLALVFAFRHHRALVSLVAALAIAAVISSQLGESYQRLEFLVATRGLNFFITAIVTVAILMEVLRARTVSTDLVAGAVCLYLTLGLAWAFFYYWFSILLPGSIFEVAIRPGSAPLSVMESRFNEIMYYSFSCLTSIGSSGEENLTRMARQFGVVECATGQLYLAVLVSRLVGFSTSGGTEPSKG